MPRASYEFEDDHGQPGRIDLAYPEHQLAIECDGYEFHGTREAFESDRLRNSRLAALGWRVMQVTWQQFQREPTKLVQRVREALRYGTTDFGK